MTELSPTATCSHLGHGGDDGGLVHQPVDRRVQQVCLCGPRAARQGGEVFTVRGILGGSRPAGCRTHLAPEVVTGVSAGRLPLPGQELLSLSGARAT